jgi:hypothetical protein
VTDVHLASGSAWHDDPMPVDLIRVDPAEFPPEAQPCLRCGSSVELAFAGTCVACTDELRATMGNEARAVEGAEYVPKMNVTPNAVALKDD